MATLKPARRKLLLGAAGGLVAVVGASNSVWSMSKFRQSTPEHISIENASLRQRNDRWLFDCRALIDLPSEIRLGLESGVPLQFIVSLKVTKPVRFWRDTVLLNAEHRFRLVYYELTRHYRVQAIDGDHSLNKRSLLSALEELGTVRGMDVTDWVVDESALIDGDEARVASVTIALDQSALPLPLQPLFSSKWRMASEEFVWPLS